MQDIFKSALQELVQSEVSKLTETLRDQLKQEFEEAILLDPFLSRNKVSQYLDVSLGTVDNMVKNGLPKHKIGSSTRFKRSQVDAFVMFNY